jgi:hypothetical protein
MGGKREYGRLRRAAPAGRKPIAAARQRKRPPALTETVALWLSRGGIG